MNIDNVLVEAPKKSDMTLQDKAEVEVAMFFETSETNCFKLNKKQYKISYRKDLKSVVITDESNNVLIQENDFDGLVEELVMSAELKMRHRRKVYPVRSLEEGQAIFIKLRDDSGEGASTFPDATFNSGYNTSYNGRVWFEGSLAIS